MTDYTIQNQDSVGREETLGEAVKRDSNRPQTNNHLSGDGFSDPISDPRIHNGLDTKCLTDKLSYGAKGSFPTEEITAVGVKHTPERVTEVVRDHSLFAHTLFRVKDNTNTPTTTYNTTITHTANTDTHHNTATHHNT